MIVVVVVVVVVSVAVVLGSAAAVGPSSSSNISTVPDGRIRQLTKFVAMATPLSSVRHYCNII